jgi:hypothetical protein
MNWVGCRIAGAVVLAAALTAQPVMAQNLNVRALTGWWIAIDDTFPKLWEQGVSAMDEVLIVNADGRFEDRVMNFFSGSAEICTQRRICADLPLIAYGRLRATGNALSIGERGAPPNRLDSQTTDPLIRRVAFSASRQWTATVKDGLMTLQSANMSRTFARIEPKRLQRLRAGFMVSHLPPKQHWRCFFANATAQDAAFAALRGQSTRGAPAAPAFLDRYLRVASYLITLDAMIRYPLADDPATRAFLGNEPEQLMLEEFDDVKSPINVADTNRLKARVSALETRVLDKMRERGGGGAAPATQGRPAISDAEIDAFAQAASDEPAATKLFCRER